MADSIQNRSNRGSSFTMIEQGKSFGEKLKREAKAIVNVVTDDASYDNALLLRDDEAGIIRLGVCSRNGRIKTEANQWFERGQTWAVVGVKRSHIKSMTVVG